MLCLRTSDYLLIALILSHPQPSRAGVLSLFPAGTSNVRASIESAVATRGASSVLYNPAVLVLEDQPRGLAIDAGYLKLSYSRLLFVNL